jgi:hypothetical protein
MNKHLQYAINKAKAHEYEPSMEHHVCAVVVRGGSILSVGFNQRKTNAFVELYKDYSSDIQNQVRHYHLMNGGISRFEKIRYFQEKLFIRIIKFTILKNFTLNI